MVIVVWRRASWLALSGCRVLCVSWMRRPSVS
uniref:Uncharacterized protein n=1 Tax=Siphoviridae sp. ctZgu8 TaxID=2827893 RepID=A0A8S5SKW3_9CAUD|nr:MAG TPA: hypothetical protein [Siphoviridae sp. ctZgu8]